MAEVKTGLECYLGYTDQTVDPGVVYYNAFTGSAGTKASGVGTKDNSGTMAIHVGSGVVICSGIVVNTGSSDYGTVAAASNSGSVVCYNVEMGSDGTLSINAGAESTSVANAIANRAATQSGYAPLAYLTVDDTGTLEAGSIVDERTFADPTRLTYITGVSDSYSDSPVHVFDGSAYKHSKAQRIMGELIWNADLTSGTTQDPWQGCAGNFMTVDRICLELDYMGIAGTSEETYLLTNCVKNSESYNHPEEGKVGREFSAFYGSRMLIT